MEKHIIGENGISYTLGADGLYYPDLQLPEGKLNDHLHELDGECYERMELLMEQMKAEAGITEELKTSDQMKWVGLMNNVRSLAEEIVLDELIYV